MGLCSVFEGGVIPYPKRDFITEEENEDKADTGASRIGCDKARAFLYVFIVSYICLFLSFLQETFNWSGEIFNT